MLGSTHKRISERICGELGITGKREVGLLLGGSTYPDSWANFPHHYGKDKEIVDNTLHARKLYLECDDECFHSLGIALHYIADKWTMRPRLADQHTDWEIKIDTSSIIDNSKFKEAISDSVIPSKIVQGTLELFDAVSRGPSSISSSEQDFSGKVVQYSLICRPKAEVEGDKPNGRSAWGSPLLDLNFAYRVCFQVSKAVLTPPPPENPDFYVKGKRLQEQLEGLPDSYIKSNYVFTSLQKVANIDRLVEFAHYDRRYNFSVSSIFIFDYDSLRMEEVRATEQVEKIVKVKDVEGLFRKREVEKERSIRENIEKTAFRVYLGTKTFGKGETTEGYLDCDSKSCARFVLDKLKWIAINPNCEERQSVRKWDRGDPLWWYIGGLGKARRGRPVTYEDLVDYATGRGPDVGQRAVYIRWTDFANLRVPLPEHLEEMYQRIDVDQSELRQLKSNASTWF